MTKKPCLSTTIATLTLPHPFILASGIMDEDAGSMKRMYKSGAAAVVTKSIGMHQRMGHPNPTFIQLEHGVLNAMGLPNPGIKAFSEEIQKMKKENAIIIGSIFGKDRDEFRCLSESMQHNGVDAIELNLSCPHAKGYGLEIGQDADEIKKITKAVTDAVTLPVFVKLSPNVTNICELAMAAEQGGAAAIVAINTVKAMKIDIETTRPVLANKMGGYSGEAIRPIGIRNVYDIYESVNIPIIGVGGISCAEDAVEYLMAGATALQIGSAIYSKGIDVFTTIRNDLEQWMINHDYDSIKQLIGISH